MAIAQIFIIVEHQMRKKADFYIYCSTTIKMSINHKSDRQIDVMECFSITIF